MNHNHFKQPQGGCLKSLLCIVEQNGRHVGVLGVQTSNHFMEQTGGFVFYSQKLFLIIATVMQLGAILFQTMRLSCLVYLTNWMWFSVACTLIYNDICHYSSQNVVDSQGTTTTFDLFFTTISTSKKNDFESWKRHCMIHLCEQPCVDSCLQPQISQPHCEINSTCGKVEFSLMWTEPWLHKIESSMITWVILHLIIINI